MKLEDLKKIAAWKTLDEKKNEIISWMEDVKIVKQKEPFKNQTYKRLEKTSMTYEWHPVYEIEFSNGLKILWAKVDGKLIQLKKKSKEVNYGDLVQNELGEWTKDSTTKSRNKRWAEYYKATIKMV